MPRRRKVRADDLFKMRFPMSPAISPNGTEIVFAVKNVDGKNNKYQSHLYRVPVRGGRARQLTYGDQIDSSPAWRPDGKEIAFVSTREKKANLWILPADGGEARQLTKLEGGIQGLEWSPDGRRLLFLFREQKKEDPKEKEKKPAYKHITRLWHKLDGDGWFPKDRWHIWIANARTGKTTRLTSGEFDVRSPRWSPDGKWIAFISCLDEDADYQLEKHFLYMVRPSGGRPKQITKRRGVRDFLAWAPEGKSILFAGHFGGPGEWIKRKYKIWELDVATERYKDLTPRLDNWPFNGIVTDTALGEAAEIIPYRDSGGWRIAFNVDEHGACRTYSIPRRGGALRLEFGGEVNTIGLSANPDGAAVVVAATMDDIGDVYSLRLDGSGKSRRLTHTNRALFNRLALTRPEETWFRNGRLRIHGWILKPPGFRSDRKYPMLLEVHGGPMAQYGYTFFHEMHLLAARGYVVVFTNPRGSSGYGVDWVKSIEGRWGTIDYDDLMAVTDAMVRKPYVDGRRLGVLGGSYGGFMTTWILGHTDRFKAGVTMRQAGNRLIQFGASDVGWHEIHRFKAPPWKKPLAYLAQSPNFYAHRIEAPLLIIHNEQDLRCPIAQAEELFRFLKYQKKTVELLAFEGESHGLSRGGRPQNRLERLKRIVDWFERYL
jgi:dipeptidyl aminopeptidase/acylaminoacyl peptidase